MHELPQALPFRQILQSIRAVGGSAAGAVLRSDAITGSRLPRRRSQGGINSPAHSPLPATRAASSSSTYSVECRRDANAIPSRPGGRPRHLAHHCRQCTQPVVGVRQSRCIGLSAAGHKLCEVYAEGAPGLAQILACDVDAYRREHTPRGAKYAKSLDPALQGFRNRGGIAIDRVAAHRIDPVGVIHRTGQAELSAASPARHLNGAAS